MSPARTQIHGLGRTDLNVLPARSCCWSPMPFPHEAKLTLSETIASPIIRAMEITSCTFKIAPNLRACGLRFVTLDSYRTPDAIAVRAGDARESAMVAQLVPAAEIH